MRGATCTLRLVLATRSFFNEVVRVVQLVLAARRGRHSHLYPQHIARLADEHFRYVSMCV